MTAEFELAVECCRWAFAQQAEQRVRHAAADVDWPSFLALVRRHRIEALAWHSVEKLALPIAGDVRAALSAEAGAIVAKNLLIARECTALQESFARRGMPLLFLKGLTLGALAYPDPFLKSGWDIDVLVLREQVEEAGEMLGALGYRPVEPASAAGLRAWHQVSKESVWFKRENGFHLELHSRLADNVRMIPEVGMQSPRQQVEVAPGVVLPTLGLPHLFAYLCVHGASSAWFRLKWIADLAGLLHGRSEREIAALHRSAIGLGAGRSADQALLLASNLFGTIGGTALQQRLERDPVSRWLARAALGQLAGPGALKEPTERPFGTAQIHLTQFLLLPGLGFKTSEMFRQARHSLLRFRR